MNLNTLVSVPVSPYFLKKDLYRSFRIKELLDENKRLTTFLNEQENNGSVLHQIFEVLNLLSSDEKIRDNLKDFQAIVPFVFDEYYYKEYGNFIEKVSFKCLKGYDDRLELEEYLEALLARIYSKLKRSDQNIELPAGIAKDEILKPLEERINTQYQLFYQKLEHQLTKSTLLKGKAKCKKAMLQLLFSDYWIYPALPALFALSAAVQIFCNRSPSKESLLKINIAPHIADIKIADTRVIHKELIDLTNKLEKDLANHLGALHHTVGLPYTSKIHICKPAFSFSAYKKEPVEQITDWNKYFSKRLAFPTPVCRVHLVALELAQFAQLDSQKTAKLYENITNYLLDFNYNGDNIKEEYGETILHLIQFFRIFTKPDIYYAETALNVIFNDNLNNLEKDELKFFITRENPTRDKAVKNFFDTYFVYTQLGKELIYRSAPYRPYTGSGKNLPKYYRKSIDNFWGTSSGKKEIRKKIQQHLTVRDAIKLVTLHEDEPTSFKSEAEKYWKKIKQKYLNDLEREKEKITVIEWDKYESLPEDNEESVQELLYDEAMCAVGFYFAELVRIAPYYTVDTMES